MKKELLAVKELAATFMADGRSGYFYQ